MFQQIAEKYWLVLTRALLLIVRGERRYRFLLCAMQTAFIFHVTSGTVPTILDTLHA